LVMCNICKMPVVLGTHYMEKRKTEDYMERHNNEGHQPDECDVE